MVQQHRHAARVVVVRRAHVCSSVLLLLLLLLTVHVHKLWLVSNIRRGVLQGLHGN